MSAGLLLTFCQLFLSTPSYQNQNKIWPALGAWGTQLKTFLQSSRFIAMVCEILVVFQPLYPPVFFM